MIFHCSAHTTTTLPHTHSHCVAVCRKILDKVVPSCGSNNRIQYPSDSTDAHTLCRSLSRCAGRRCCLGKIHWRSRKQFVRRGSTPSIGGVGSFRLRQWMELTVSAGQLSPIHWRRTALHGSPHYTVLRTTRFSVLHGFPYDTGVRTTPVSVLYACPYYTGVSSPYCTDVRTTRMSVLHGCPYYTDKGSPYNYTDLTISTQVLRTTRTTGCPPGRAASCCSSRCSTTARRYSRSRFLAVAASCTTAARTTLCASAARTGCCTFCP